MFLIQKKKKKFNSIVEQVKKKNSIRLFESFDNEIMRDS